MMSNDDSQTRQKIQHVAFSLFLERGYENTSVQAIIDAVGIAKGTFYHHFRSKEEMLVDLVERMTRRVVEVILPIVDDPGLPAVEKLMAVTRAAAARKSEDMGPEAMVLVRQMRSKANRLLAESIDELSRRWLVPIYARCLRQGVAEGTFRIRNPDLTAELFLGAIVSMVDRITDLFLAAMEGDDTAVDRLTEVYLSVEEALERLVGAPEGSLPLYSSIDLRALLARSSSELHSPGGNP